MLDFFIFPEIYIGFRLECMRKLLSQIDAPAFDMIFEFSAGVPRMN